MPSPHSARRTRLLSSSHPSTAWTRMTHSAPCRTRRASPSLTISPLWLVAVPSSRSLQRTTLAPSGAAHLPQPTSAPASSAGARAATSTRVLLTGTRGSMHRACRPMYRAPASPMSSARPAARLPTSGELSTQRATSRSRLPSTSPGARHCGCTFAKRCSCERWKARCHHSRSPVSSAWTVSISSPRPKTPRCAFAGNGCASTTRLSSSCRTSCASSRRWGA
mmetsp:Transcript_22003/g.56157  ORF Transcript_22003/g.56157 Transcript_22003/m.56157 type:complete len:222 (+) Transcript_22003:167-832(+)